MKALRTFSVPPVLALVGVLALPAEVADAGYVFRVSFRGRIALATWTTCPVWSLGVVCEDTHVIASSSATMEGRLRDVGPRLILRRYVYRVVDLGDEWAGESLLESIGGTAAATVSIDPRARKGYARSGAVPMKTCTEEPAGWTCRSDSASFEGWWTGSGVLRRYDERFVHGTRYFVMRTYTLGWERSATAFGVVDGRRVPGTFVPEKTMLVNARQGELRAYPGPRRD